MSKDKQINKVHSLVLAYYNTTAPATNALNRSATARVTNDAGAERQAARVYNTVLTARGTAIGRAISLLQRTGVSLRRLGLPCRTGGFYMPVKEIATAQNVHDDAMLELDTIREDIIATYPNLMEGLRLRLGKFADEVTIPSATEVASKFTMTLTIVNSHVSLQDSVLKGVADEVANRVRAESQAHIDDMLRQAHSGPVADLRDTLVEFIDRLRNAKRLHLTQFDKLRDEVRRVRDLNIMDLPEINDLLDSSAEVIAAGTGGVDDYSRGVIASKADKIVKQADATLASLGL